MEGDPPIPAQGAGAGPREDSGGGGFVKEASAEAAPSSGAVAFAELVVPGLPWGDAD